MWLGGSLKRRISSSLSTHVVSLPCSRHFTFSPRSGYNIFRPPTPIHLSKRHSTTLTKFEPYFESLVRYHFPSILSLTHLHSKHQELSDQLMNINLTPNEMTKIAKEYNASEKKIHLISLRTSLLNSVRDLSEMIREEQKK
jgi:adenine C2-methylase RlmN of 23S rRNA A2503 and tRNA A37